MRSCTENVYPGSLRVLVFLLCLAVVLPPLAAGSVEPSPRVRQHGDPAVWGADLDEAIGRAQASMRPILVFFTAPDCTSCDQIRHFTLKDAALQPVIRKFERVKIDLSKRPELVALFKIKKLPAFYVIAPAGRIQGHKQGYVTAKALKKYLESLVVGHWSALEIDRLISALTTGRASADQWRKALSSMENSDIRKRILILSHRLSPHDIKIVTGLLGDGQLAVRLGALDLLEQVNDTIAGSDPWADPTSAGQQDLLKRWQRWADSGQGPSTRPAVLTQEKFDRHIQDLIGDDPQRSRRALQVLQRGGQHTARLIVDYFQAHPALDTNALRRIKEVQYALVIPAADGLDPQAIAHRIVWGNPDVQIRTIRQLADCGIGPSAILVDLLTHEDPLARETAVEILFKAAGPLAVAPVKKLLQREKDPDVSFSVLKYLGDTKTTESQKILQSYFTHENEDLVIAAVEGAVKLSVGSIGAQLLPLLKDPRWRVRVAAIEGIKKKGGRESGLFDQLRGKEMRVSDRVAKALCQCLEDPDEFVRHTAAAALGHLEIDGAEGPLKKAYDRHPDMRGIVVSVLIAMGKSVPSSYIDQLFGPEPDDLLFVLDNIKEINGSGRKLVRQAAKSENPDIAGSALRIIAGSEKRQASDNAQLISALQSGKAEKQLTVLQEFDLDSDEIKSVRETLKSNRSPEKGRPRRSRNTHADVLLAAADLMDDPSASELVRADAMQLLYQYGHADAFKKASETWPELTASVRTIVAGSLRLYGHEAIPLFRRALDDDYTDVWQTALNQLYDEEGRKLFADPLRDYLMQPAVRLTPSMMWSEGLHRLCSEDPRALRPFAQKILSAPGAFPPDRLILALTVYSLTGVSEDEQPSVIALAEADNPLIRRAAWLALVTQSEAELEKYTETVLADPSRYVRELIPAVLHNNDFDKTRVTLYFSEEEYFSGYNGLQIDFEKATSQAYDIAKVYEYVRGRTISPAVIDRLKSLIANDPDPLIRFRCMLCLLSYKIPLDLGQVKATARLSGNPYRVAELLGEFFSSHSHNLGETFKVLLPLLQTADGESSSEYMVESLLTRWGGQEQSPGEAQLSFTSIQDQPPAKPIMATFTDAFTEYAGQIDSPVEIVLFETAGCRRCFAVEKIIQVLKFQHRNLHVHRYDILTRQGLAYNEALSRKFMTEDSQYAIAPAVFMAGGYLIDRDITISSLEQLISFSAIDNTGKSPLTVSSEELAAAESFIRERRNSISWYGAAQAGFFKGLNPLAVAALSLALYYLSSAGRTGLSIMRYGTIYMVTTTVVTIAFWLLPKGDIAKLTHLHDVSGVLTFLILIYMVLIALRFLFRSLWRLGKKRKGKAKKQKIKKIPSRRYVVWVVVLWAVVLSVLDILSLGNAHTITLVYSIKNQISLFPTMMLLILFCTLLLLPSAGILWSFAKLTHNTKIQPFVDRHQFLANMVLSAIWIWIAVRYVQGL
jgi:HEAT repeat protein/thiol-disulfide isomerase/thioredoxin